MDINNIKVTVHKEVRGIIRDKKSLQKLILYPLIIPLVIFLFGFLFNSYNGNVYSVGINYDLTPDEKDLLKDIDNLSLIKYDTEKDLEQAYDNNEISGYIIKENNIYTVYADRSQTSGEMVFTYSNEYLDTYNNILGLKYLNSNNIDPVYVFGNLDIRNETLNEDDNSSFAMNIIYLVIAYIIMIVAMVSIVIVPDATSGEKERGTLETILTFPIKSSELVLGKYLATVLLSFIIGIISYLLIFPSFLIVKEMFVTFDDVLVNMNISNILLVILILFLCSLLTAGVCMALTGKSKTFKEAQSALQFIPTLSIIPYFLNILEIDNYLFNLIPIANCVGALNNLIAGSISISTLLVIIFSTIVYIVVILFYLSKQYNKEETLFS